MVLKPVLKVESGFNHTKSVPEALLIFCKGLVPKSIERKTWRPSPYPKLKGIWKQDLVSEIL
jgi:hypothetical protein